jgi:tRNA pseudouridine38-40 synthase
MREARTMLLRLTLEYDGTGFRGWARQPGRRTVEGTVRDGLGRVFGDVNDLAVAGRTDTGVHAAGQVVSVSVTGGPPAEHVAEAMNAVLPADVAVLDAAEAPPGFSARFSATARSYRYVVLNRHIRSALDAHRALWWPRPVSGAALAAAAAALVGEHDFRAFTPTVSRHRLFRRTVTAAAWEQHGDRLVFRITADSFLRHMVRSLVGTMLELGDEAPETMRELLQGRPRAEAGLTAPPWGLVLEHVAYDEATVATV